MIIKNPITVINSGGDGGSSYQRPSDWLTIPTMSGTTDEIYILNGVLEHGMNMIVFSIIGTGQIDWGDGTAVQSFNYSSATQVTHTYNYSDLSSSSWTNHNNSKQALVHITATRGTITYFSTAGLSYSYTNADGNVVVYGNNGSSSIYQISANVSRASVYCSSQSLLKHKNLEIFEWKGAMPTRSNINNMFYDCVSLQLVDLDTSNVINMNYMFYNCYSLRTIPELDTTNVTSMLSMFSNCNSLQTIPLLNTGNVTDMGSMFSGCYSLQDIPLFNTSKVTSMSGMFYGCLSLPTIPLFNTSKVTNMGSMFYNCGSLQTIPQLNTKSVTNMQQMFYGCVSLQTIPQLNTSNVTSFYQMFNSCYSLQNIPEIDFSNATSVANMFYNCYPLQTVKLYNFNPNSSSSLTLSNFTNSKMLTKQALVDLFNSIATNTNSYSRTITLGSTLQSYLSNCYVKDSGEYYTTILPTSDTTIDPLKTYYTYNASTGTYTQVTPDFSTDTFYYELVTATWNKYVICESTDTGAMLALDYARNIKKYSIG